MRHIFIINPTAGKKNCTAELMAMAKRLGANHSTDVECILTRSPGHATECVRTIAQTGDSGVSTSAAATVQSMRWSTVSPEFPLPP